MTQPPDTPSGNGHGGDVPNRPARGETGSYPSSRPYPANQPYPQGPQQGPAYGQYPGGGYGYEPPRPKSGLAITALVLGIVAIALSWIPFIGLSSLLLGLLAIVFGIIALVKKQNKVLAITGIVLGALGIIIAGAVTALAAVVFNEVSEEHTVQYSVTSDGPARVTYLDGLETVETDVPGNWEQEIMFTGLPVGLLTIESDGGQVTCEIVMDGQPVASDSGAGKAECLSQPAP